MSFLFRSMYFLIAGLLVGWLPFSAMAEPWWPGDSLELEGESRYVYGLTLGGEAKKAYDTYFKDHPEVEIEHSMMGTSERKLFRVGKDQMLYLVKVEISDVGQITKLLKKFEQGEIERDVFYKKLEIERGRVDGHVVVENPDKKPADWFSGKVYEYLTDRSGGKRTKKTPVQIYTFEKGRLVKTEQKEGGSLPFPWGIGVEPDEDTQ